MGLLDTIRYKYELHRLEKRYTRREGRTTFVSGAQYIDGEYVYPDLPSPSTSSSSSPSSPSASSSTTSSPSSPSITSGAAATATGFAFPSTMTRSPSAGWMPGSSSGENAGMRRLEEEDEEEEQYRGQHEERGQSQSQSQGPWDHVGSAMNGFGSPRVEKKAFWKRG